MRPALVAASVLLLSAGFLATVPAAQAQVCILNAQTGDFRCVVESHEVCDPGSWCIETDRVCVGTLC